MKYIFFTLLLSHFAALQAQNIEQKIDNLLDTIYLPSEPGAVYLVSKGGEVVYRKAFGTSNLELGTPMIVDNVFQIGSMTKQFTAIGILVLAGEGKLDLNTSLDSYIKDYPNGANITIHQLLTHTSGIKDFTEMRELRNIARQDMTPSELVDFFKNESPDFEPGEKFKYNNSGYLILGYLIEIISDMSYEDFVEQRIFKKVGMNSSRYASHSEVIMKRASGYQKRKDEIFNKMNISLTIPFSSGSLMSTVDDMAMWQKAIQENLLLNEEFQSKAFNNYSLNDGTKINYGYGWHLREIDGVSSREHGGSIFGFKSMGVYIPDLDIYVIGLTNCDCNSPTKLIQQIAKLVVSDFND